MIEFIRANPIYFFIFWGVFIAIVVAILVSFLPKK
jgi:hypothetical protein